ncbi:MAG: hypothetical protein KDM81_17875, partial [Verrucomicrobiae bacterium]|nr:hypothetical protein [Verrucomicrobiae bacterium]
DRNPDRNPEGCQRLAGGRSAAETPGQRVKGDDPGGVATRPIPGPNGLAPFQGYGGRLASLTSAINRRLR